MYQHCIATNGPPGAAEAELCAGMWMQPLKRALSTCSAAAHPETQQGGWAAAHLSDFRASASSNPAAVGCGDTGESS